jgi:hypothetical protein
LGADLCSPVEWDLPPGMASRGRMSATAAHVRRGVDNAWDLLLDRCTNRSVVDIETPPTTPAL